VVSAIFPPNSFSDYRARSGWRLSRLHYSRFRFSSTDFPAWSSASITVSLLSTRCWSRYPAIEEAVNSVPGLRNVRSITSRGSAEVDLFFDWNSDMVLTLQRVDAVVARLQTELPSTAKVETHRLTFAAFPILATA